MNEGIITARYAKSLFQTAVEESKIEKIYADILGIETILKESSDFVDYIQSPVFKESEKTQLFTQIFKDNVDSLTFNFLLLLIDNKREIFLASICRYLQLLYKEKMGIQEGSIVTAIPLDNNSKEEVNQLIRKKFNIEIELKEKVDPSIIGGFILRIEDQQIDASISSQLKKIKTELINSY
jgi:F-type H+-transporting ATPase subunit delta